MEQVIAVSIEADGSLYYVTSAGAEFELDTDLGAARPFSTVSAAYRWMDDNGYSYCVAAIVRDLGDGRREVLHGDRTLAVV